MGSVVVIERIAEPLEGGRAQLVEYVFEDGVQDVSATCRRGSPAALAVVREHEETLTIDDDGIRVRRMRALHSDATRSSGARRRSAARRAGRRP